MSRVGNIFKASTLIKIFLFLDRKLYFHALNSFREITVSLKLVNNSTKWFKNPALYETEFVEIGNRGTQCESATMDSDGNLYCSIISSNALTSWSSVSQQNYNADSLKVVAYNPEQIKFVTGMKINRNSLDENELFMISSDPKVGQYIPKLLIILVF